MYTRTMDSDELFKEFKKEADELLRQTRKYILSRDFKILRREGQRFPVEKITEVKLTSGNLYLIIITVPDRRSLFRDDFPVQVSTILNEVNINGYKVVTFSDLKIDSDNNIIGRAKVITITPHLLVRYKERLHLEEDGKELIKQFMKDFAVFVAKKEDYSTEELIASTAKGVVLGKCHRNELTDHFELKTFIADETIKKGEKKECIDIYNEVLDEIISENSQQFEHTRSIIKATKMLFYRKTE